MQYTLQNVSDIVLSVANYFGMQSHTLFNGFLICYAGETVPEITARLKRDLVPTIKSGILYWPACDFITFKFVPVHLQVNS